MVQIRRGKHKVPSTVPLTRQNRLASASFSIVSQLRWNSENCTKCSSHYKGRIRNLGLDSVWCHLRVATAALAPFLPPGGLGFYICVPHCLRTGTISDSPLYFHNSPAYRDCSKYLLNPSNYSIEMPPFINTRTGWNFCLTSCTWSSTNLILFNSVLFSVFLPDSQKFQLSVIIIPSLSFI